MGLPSVSTVTSSIAASVPTDATYCAGRMPAYSWAAWTVTAVLEATPCPLASVTVADSVNCCAPSPPTSAAASEKDATPSASVVVVPLARTGSRREACRAMSVSAKE